jgi:isoleucyl-tRNA synthetase
VWFDSGSSHLAVLTAANDLTWPADLYMEGGDQYRGWFHSSLLVGVGLKGSSPYRACALNGWVLDGEGHAMHKSLGNSIEPDQIIKHHGADLVRLWSASVEFHEDVRVSEVILTRLQEAYRKLRNTFRYLLGNLSGFDPRADAVPVHDLLELDQWILIRAESLVAGCRGWYDEFAFHKVYRALYDFATLDLSALYFDVLKDRLYTAATKSHARRSAQTALYRLEYALVRLIAPILMFTAEEVWTHMGQTGSVHLELFPEAGELTAGLSDAHRKRSGNWDRLMTVREDVLKSLEQARREKFIGAPLEARVRLTANSDLYPLLAEYAKELPALFIVSQVEVVQASACDGLSPGISARIERADGLKCERCWKYTTDTGADPRFPTACAACAAAIKEMLDDRHSPEGL